MLRRVIGALAAFAFAATLCGAASQARPAVFAAAPVDQVLDLHGDPAGAQLVIFMAGNQYLVMPRLLAAFRRQYPQVRDIFYETLPPGVVVRQVRAGSLQMGNLRISAQ